MRDSQYGINNKFKSFLKNCGQEEITMNGDWSEFYGSDYRNDMKNTYDEIQAMYDNGEM